MRLSVSSAARTLLLLAAAWIFLGVARWDRTLRSYEQRFLPQGWSVPDSARQRVFLDNDPYYWLTYAGEMIDRGSWRIRFTGMDNAPFGREMHWSQSIAWLMVAFGEVRRWIFGQPWPAALEDGAIWINPFLHLLLLAAGGCLLARRLGLLPALLWGLGIISLGDLDWAFHPLRPDHQSLHILCSSLSLLLLGMGGLGWSRRATNGETLNGRWWREARPPTPAAARRYMAASGVLGGLGLWTGATVQILTLGAAVGAAVYLVINMPVRRNAEEVYHPDLWRWWAAAGAFTSVVFYLVEYAGAWPGIRLEVNSPLHALSWLCAGELLTRLARCRLSGSVTRGDRMVLGLVGTGLLLLPLTLLVGSPEWHVARDQGMQRLHNFIQEFYTYRNFRPGALLKSLAQSYGLLPLLIPAALWLSAPRRSNTYEWALLWLGFAWAVAMGMLSWQQVRWLPFFSAALPFLLAVTVAVLARRQREPPTRTVTAAWLVAVAAILQSAWFLWGQYREVRTVNRQTTQVVQELTKAILTKHLALRMGAADSPGSFRFLCEPDLAGPLYYFGRIPSVTSFYWENQSGLRDAVAFFSDESDREAREVARRRGLTHVLLPQGMELADVFQFIRDGRFDRAAASATLVGRLLRNQPPDWLHLDIELTAAGHGRYRYGPGGVHSSMTVYDIVLPSQHDP